MPTLAGELPAGSSPPSRLHWSQGFIFAATRGWVARWPENGGAPVLVATLGPGETAASPQLLPDGDSVLFTLGSGSPNPDGTPRRSCCNRSAYPSRSTPFGVFVQPVPATGARYQISATTEIGHHPFWSPDGKELFYLGAERGGLLVGVSLIVSNGVAAGESTVFPRTLVANTNATGQSNYDMMPDARSFVGIRGAVVGLVTPEPARSTWC